MSQCPPATTSRQLIAIIRAQGRASWEDLLQSDSLCPSERGELGRENWGKKTTEIWHLLVPPLPAYWVVLSQTLSLAQGNGNSAVSRAADKLKYERMTGGACEKGEGKGPSRPFHGVNAFCRWPCPALSELCCVHSMGSSVQCSTRGHGGPPVGFLSFMSQML